MTDLTVSVIIVSRERPDALRRCLLGISQLQYRALLSHVRQVSL